MGAAEHLNPPWQRREASVRRCQHQLPDNVVATGYGQVSPWGTQPCQDEAICLAQPRTRLDRRYAARKQLGCPR